jgi:hypothetical protein
VTPSPWLFIILVLTGHRLTRLIGWDGVTETLRKKYLGIYVSPGIRSRHPELGKFIGCAYCVGFWVSLIIYLLWLAAGHPGAEGWHSWMLYAAMPFALSSGVGITSRMLDP